MQNIDVDYGEETESEKTEITYEVLARTNSLSPTWSVVEQQLTEYEHATEAAEKLAHTYRHVKIIRVTRVRDLTRVWVTV